MPSYLAARISCALLLLVLPASAALAEQSQQQLDSEKNWYQIELIVFARNSSDQQNEFWPAEPRLSYPEDLTLLTAPETVSTEHLAALDLTLLAQPTADSPAIETATLPTTVPMTEQALAAQTADIDAAAEPISAAVPPLAPEREKPFILLPASALTLTEQAAKLRNSRNLRILTHIAWRQPIVERAKATSLLINGGDQFDQHFELEGSILIGLERYLHIETKLWLNSFVSKALSANNNWPLLPPNPFFSRSPTATDPFDFGTASTTANQQNSYLAGPAIPMGFPPAADIAAPGYTSKLRILNDAPTASLFSDPFLQEFGNQYAVSRSVLLQQNRRMRSNELHYIDHPLMGLLIIVSSYEPGAAADQETAERSSTDGSPPR